MPKHLAVRHCHGPITANSARIYWRRAFNEARGARGGGLVGILRGIAHAIRFAFLPAAAHRGGDRLNADLAVAIIELGLAPGVLLFVGEFFSLHDLTSESPSVRFSLAFWCRRPVRQNCALN